MFKTFYIYSFRVQLGEAPLVKTASSVFQDLCYNYRDQLMAGIICAGWDRRHGGQVRYVGVNTRYQVVNYKNISYRYSQFRLGVCVFVNRLPLVDQVLLTFLALLIRITVVE